jgi:hypothetical protein
MNLRIIIVARFKINLKDILIYGKISAAMFTNIRGQFPASTNKAKLTSGGSNI